MNSVWFACPSVTEDFSCFFLQVSVWQSLSYSRSLRFQKDGCCCSLLHQQSFWWFLILSFASPTIPIYQGKGKCNENILFRQLVLLTLILTKTQIIYFNFIFLEASKIFYQSQRSVLKIYDIQTRKHINSGAVSEVKAVSQKQNRVREKQGSLEGGSSWRK